jgi:hypothetical protein
VAENYDVVVDVVHKDRDAQRTTVEPIAKGNYPTTEWREGEVVIDTHVIKVPPDIPDGLYYVKVALVDQTGTVPDGKYVQVGIVNFVDRSRNFETPPVQYPLGVDLGNVVQIIGYDLPIREVQAGRTFPLVLYWRALDEMDESYTVFIHVVGPDGVIRGQWDSIPGGGEFPTTGWVEGEVIRDEYYVLMNQDAPPWQYTILVGMYDARTGERLIVSNRPEATDHVALGTVRVVE